MKIYSFIVTFIIAGFLSAQAQGTYSMETLLPIDYETGSYYKDSNSLFDKYTGEWSWSDANTSITLNFIKTEHVQRGIDPHYYYSDKLTLEVKIIENGVETINTYGLPTMSQNFASSTTYIPGPNKINVFYTEPCGSSTTDSKSKYSSYDVMYSNNGVERLEFIRDQYSSGRDQASTCSDFSSLKMPENLTFTRF